MLIVLNPRSSPDEALRDWDLWGPFIFGLLLSLFLALSAPAGQTTLLFTGVITIVTAGSIVVTANVILLGAPVSFFQSVCAIGHCLVPITAASLICLILSWFVFRLVTVPVALWWSVSALARLFGPKIPQNRKLIGLYPCALMYAILGWIVFIH
jgi:hypothetical protein